MDPAFLWFWDGEETSGLEWEPGPVAHSRGVDVTLLVVAGNEVHLNLVMHIWSARVMLPNMKLLDREGSSPETHLRSKMSFQTKMTEYTRMPCVMILVSRLDNLQTLHIRSQKPTNVPTDFMVRN